MRPAFVNRMSALVRARNPELFGWVREWHRQAAAWRYGDDLVGLATFFGTDKWGAHWYAEIYASHFARLRDRPINLLEIGVGGYEVPQSGGASLRMWKAYFPHGHIHGVDIYDKSPIEEPRIRVFRGSQSDQKFLAGVWESIGRVDIVIDDGSHDNDRTIATFKIAFPMLSDGGYYAIEDVETSYLPEYGGHAGADDDPNTIIGFFKTLAVAVQGRPGAAAEPWRRRIRAMHFHRDLIIIEKGDPDGPQVPR